MGKTKFSVVITCRNQENFISDAVGSALAQSHAAREVIVVDDASTDGSVRILKSYGNQIRLLVLESNQGVAAARDAGTALAQGEYVAYLDGDDALKLWALELYDQIIQARSPVLILARLLFCGEQLPNNSDRELPPQIEFVSYENWIEKDRMFRPSASAVVVKGTALEEVGGWKGEVWPFEDYFLLAKLAYSGRTIQILQPSTVLYRVHPLSTSRNISLVLTGCHQYVEAMTAREQFKEKPKRLARLAMAGGAAQWMVRKLWTNGRKIEGLRLLFTTAPSIAAAAIMRLRAILLGQRPTETLSLENALGQSVDIPS